MGRGTVPLSSTAIRVLRTLPLSLHGQAFPGVTTEAIKRACIRAVRRAGIEVTCATKPLPGCLRRG